MWDCETAFKHQFRFLCSSVFVTDYFFNSKILLLNGRAIKLKCALRECSQPNSLNLATFLCLLSNHSLYEHPLHISLNLKIFVHKFHENIFKKNLELLFLSTHFYRLMDELKIRSNPIVIVNYRKKINSIQNIIYASMLKFRLNFSIICHSEPNAKFRFKIQIYTIITIITKSLHFYCYSSCACWIDFLNLNKFSVKFIIQGRTCLNVFTIECELI